MALVVDPAISTSKMSIGGKRTKQGRPSRVQLVRPSAYTLPSPELKDDFDDAAKVVLIEGQEASRKRKQGEIGEKLQRIKNRIEEIVRDFDEEIDGDIDAVGAAENPRQLFKSLADPKTRSTYYHQLSQCVLSCENKCEELEGILSHLHELFVESQSGGTKQLLEQAEEEEINLEEATAVLGGALASAKASVSELVSIKGRMDRLMSNLIEFPDTNKGRKKLEQALLKAQDEIKRCLRNVEELEKKVKSYADKCSQLQTQLDAKTQECQKLQRSSEEARQLRMSHAALEKEIKALKEQKETKVPPEPKIISNVLPTGMDVGKLKKLEEELQLEKAKTQDLENQMSVLAEHHSKELEAMKAEYEAETNEIKGRFEEQLKSLMEEDDVFEEAGEDVDYNLDASPAQESPAQLEQEEKKTDSPTPEMPKEETAPESVEQEELVEEEVQEPLRLVSPSGSDEGAASAVNDRQLEELRDQFATKESQLKLQLEEAKSKHKIKVRILQKQLAEATSSRMEKEEVEQLAKKLKANLEEANEKLLQANSSVAELQKKLSDTESENTNLSEKLLQKEVEVEQLSEKISKLTVKQEEVEYQPQHQQSTELSEVPSLQSFPVVQSQVQVLPPGDSPMMSESILPLVATEAALDELPDMFPSSLEQSIVSMDPAPLGSPQGSSPLNDRDSVAQGSQHPAPYNLSMLAGSRLSHYSSAPQGRGVSHGHPIMVEWVKAYDLAVKFKDGAISMLQEHSSVVPQLSVLIEELQAVEVHKIDKKADAQNQVMEMRFSLTLMLHQLEQTLQESFSLMAERQSQPTSSAMEDQHRYYPQIEELKERVRNLDNEMAVAESHYIAQMDAHKDVIARLSTRNESLKMEVSKLKESVLLQEKIKVAMFSRVDMERNSRILRDAVNKKLLSEEELECLVDAMEDYLTVPASRLLAMAHRLLNKDEVNKLVLNICRTCSGTRQAAYMLESIVFMDQKKEDRHRSIMLKYGEKRMDLAQNISDSLSGLEKKLGTTFSKPFYGPPIPNSNGCIVPVKRDIPDRCSHYRSRPESHMEADLVSPAHGRSEKTLPPSSLSNRQQHEVRESVRTSDSIRQSQYKLIQQLQQHNHRQKKEELQVKHRATTADPSFMRPQRPQPAEFRRRQRASTATSNLHSSSPGDLKPPMRVLPSALYSSRTSLTDDHMWDVKSTQQDSYSEAKVPGYPFLPKIVELDLPGRSIVGITHKNYTSSTSADKTKPLKSSPTQSSPNPHFARQSGHKTNSIPAINVPHSTLNTLKEEGTTWTQALPTIHVPSTDPVSAAH